MNLRILIYSNPLVVDKISKKFLFWKDSGFIFTKNLIQSLPDNYRYYWLIPENITKEQKEEWFMIKNKNIELILYPYSTSIHQNRYEFYGNILKKSFPYTRDIDAVINNQPEVSANIKTWLENQRRDYPPIFNFFHWIDCPESRSFAEGLGGYFWREYDGVINAERSYFHNDYAKELFDNMVIEYIKNPVEYKSGHFSPPSTTYGKEKIELPKNKKIILFNHRLNNTTNWKFFLEEIEKLYLIRQDFLVWFTDDSDKAKSKLLDKKYIINASLPATQYGTLLQNCHFAVCTHKGYSTWNMAVIDALNEECFTIMPENEVVYKYMFKDYDPDIYHNNISITENMNALLNYDIGTLKSKARYIKEKLPEYFNNHRLENIGKDIEQSIKDRMRDNPAKYDKVLNFIKEKGKTTKCDFVNKFWTFHVNSNFLKIRWKLMSEGVTDDTTQEVSTYQF